MSGSGTTTTTVIGTCEQCCPRCPCSANFCVYYKDETTPEWTLYNLCGGGFPTEKPSMPCCDCPPPDESVGEVSLSGATFFLSMPCLGLRCTCYSCSWEWDSLLEDWVLVQECSLDGYGPASESDNCACVKPTAPGGTHGEQAAAVCRCMG